AVDAARAAHRVLRREAASRRAGIAPRSRRPRRRRARRARALRAAARNHRRSARAGAGGDHRYAALRAARRALRGSGARPDADLRARDRVGARGGSGVVAREARSVRMALTSIVNERAFAERRRADWELLESIVARADGKG